VKKLTKVLTYSIYIAL